MPLNSGRRSLARVRVLRRKPVTVIQTPCWPCLHTGPGPVRHKRPIMQPRRTNARARTSGWGSHVGDGLPLSPCMRVGRRGRGWTGADRARVMAAPGACRAMRDTVSEPASASQRDTRAGARRVIMRRGSGVRRTQTCRLSVLQLGSRERARAVVAGSDRLRAGE